MITFEFVKIYKKNRRKNVEDLEGPPFIMYQLIPINKNTFKALSDKVYMGSMEIILWDVSFEIMKPGMRLTSWEWAWWGETRVLEPPPVTRGTWRREPWNRSSSSSGRRRRRKEKNERMREIYRFLNLPKTGKTRIFCFEWYEVFGQQFFLYREDSSPKTLQHVIPKFKFLFLDILSYLTKQKKNKS